jgi:hypothetical protein
MGRGNGFDPCRKTHAKAPADPVERGKASGREKGRLKAVVPLRSPPVELFSISYRPRPAVLWFPIEFKELFVFKDCSFEGLFDGIRFPMRRLRRVECHRSG